MTQAVPASEQSAIQDVVSRFLRGYLGGDAGAIAYLVPPGDAGERARADACSW